MKGPMERLAFLFLVLLAACRTTETRGPAISAAVGELRVASPAQAWEVQCDGELAGLLVFFEADGAQEDSLYMVRNVWHQDLGMIDAFGRAYRYVPHSADPAWVGSGSVLSGVERILGRSGCRLSEIPLPAEARPATPGELEQRRIPPRNPLEPGS